MTVSHEESLQAGRLADAPPVCDYEGSGYEQDFWQNRGRDYEDRVERVALRRLLPPSGRRALEIGAGFGRLTDELGNFAEVVLLDYSSTMLARARERLGDGRYTYVAANIYAMPFRPGSFDAATMIRVVHHIADVPDALSTIRRVIRPGGTFVLEYANKRNLKAILRYLLRQQRWSPFAYDPYEFVPLNFDFHPTYMLFVSRDAGFRTTQRLPVSYFRLGWFKKVLPLGLLVGLDRLLQGWAPLYSPSVFTRNSAVGEGTDHTTEPLAFTCPHCGEDLLPQEDGVWWCETEDLRWGKRDGIYDFKTPLE